VLGFCITSNFQRSHKLWESLLEKL